MISLRVLVFALCIPLIGHAQKEAFFWHFGDYAAIDFNTGAPVAVSGSALSSIEGTSSVCDGATGNLLFYTDGITVYNRLDNVMPNGTGLHGNSSSTQCGLIVRLPGTTGIYYVFSVDQLAGTNGLKYSIVDMSLQAGLGDVTSKNVALITPICEKVTAVRHCNGIDYWILTHEWNSNAFYAYPFTASGIGSPVVTSVGMVVGGSTSNARGELKLSPDGTKLAAAYDWLGGELYDFDNSTGLVSNVITLATGVQRYGACFSPDNSKLYLTDGWQGKAIIQYDMAAANIPASAVTVGTTAAFYIGSVQNAPDGKIYVATYGLTTLGRINDPNALGLGCSYVDAAFNLTNTVRWGLPNFPGDVNVTPWAQTDSFTICQGDSVLLQAASGANYQWSTGATTQAITVNADGVYYVDWISNNCALSDTFIVVVVSAPSVTVSATDSTLCAGESATLTASGASNYVWTPGGPGASILITPTATQTYKVVGTYGIGCADSAEITITVNPLPTVNAGADTSVCSDFSLTLEVTPLMSSYLWSTGDTTGTISVQPSATSSYWVIGTDQAGCSASDTVTVYTWPVPDVEAGPDRAICAGEAVVLTATGGGDYVWQPGGFTGDSVMIFPLATTTYTVTGDEDLHGCTDTAIITLTVSDDCPPAIFLPNAFSPNGDGANDLFGITYSENFDLDVLRVFNRWGEVVFETTDASAGWDGRFRGRDQPVGSYTYLVTGNYQGEPSVISGSVTVIR
jgi:gliding motility-associated-like protein